MYGNSRINKTQTQFQLCTLSGPCPTFVLRQSDKACFYMLAEKSKGLHVAKSNSRLPVYCG